MFVGRRGGSQRLLGRVLRYELAVTGRFLHLLLLPPHAASQYSLMISSLRRRPVHRDFVVRVHTRSVGKMGYSSSRSLGHPDSLGENDPSVVAKPPRQDATVLKEDGSNSIAAKGKEPMRPLERTILNKAYNNKEGPDPKLHWAITATLDHHIRASLKGIRFESLQLRERDTNLAVCTLGTGSGAGSLLRSNSSTLVRAGGRLYLVDAGEGLNRQFLLSRLNLRDVTRIFITHMHGDHIFGLPSVLLSLQVANLHVKEKRTLEIYGPVGLFNYIAASMALSATEMRKLRITVFELMGGTQRSGRHLSNRKHYQEFTHFGVFRKTIPQNKDGTWTLVEATEITTRELAIKHNSRPKGLSVKAAEIHHVPNIQCFGFTFLEPDTQERSINIEKAQELGVADRDSIRLLKSNFSVVLPDGKEVHPDQVCGGAYKPRKVTILGDCCVVPPAMERLAMDSEVLVHEATLSETDKGRKVTVGGHSTAAEAAAFASKVRANVLLLNHLPRRADSYKGINETYNEAKRGIKGHTQAQIAYDHLELLVPRGGFGFREPVDETTPNSKDVIRKLGDCGPPEVLEEAELPG